jgi:hypothetical protein
VASRQLPLPEPSGELALPRYGLTTMATPPERSLSADDVVLVPIPRSALTLVAPPPAMLTQKNCGCVGLTPGTSRSLLNLGGDLGSVLRSLLSNRNHLVRRKRLLVRA